MNKSAKTNAIRLVESAGVPHRVYEYDVRDGRIDARAIAEKIGRSPDEVFKTLVAEAPVHRYFVFLVPAASELDLKKSARAAGCKSIEMIPQRQLLPLTGYVHGGCSPLGMKKEFPTLIDECAILYETICVSGGRIGLNLAIGPEDLAGLTGAEFADIAK
ncbi:MAG: Cys-tRNA(Pro) deacylase [Lentisphaeria bacterium]|nr:Cys-tRNA(Pro) deacylase [Lentisphaeria bacterium]